MASRNGRICTKPGPDPGAISLIAINKRQINRWRARHDSLESNAFAPPHRAGAPTLRAAVMPTQFQAVRRPPLQFQALRRSTLLGLLAFAGAALTGPGAAHAEQRVI